MCLVPFSHSIFSEFTCNMAYQFSSGAQSYLTLCDPMDCSLPGFPVHHQLLELVQTHVHRVSDIILPSYPLLSPSPPPSTFPSIRIFFKWVISSHQVETILEPQDQSFWFHIGLTGLISLLSKRFSRVFLSTTVYKHQFFGTQPSLWSNSNTVHECWENYSFDYTDLWQQSGVSAF